MQRGTDVYDAISQKVAAAQAAADRIGRDLREATQAVEAGRVADREDLARLARVRLEALRAAQVREGLDAADRRVLAILERREAAIEDLEAALAASVRRSEDLEAERRRRGERLDAARAERAAEESATLERLAGQEAYAFQRARRDRAAAQAEHAEAKAARATADREEKGRPYEEDRLFRYLWERGYGFPRYRAIPPIRALDGWVARLIRYDRTHLDYRMLLEIPRRLGEHASRLRARADEEQQALETLEREALEAAGVPALDAAIEEAAKALAAVAADLEAEEARHAGLRRERATFDAGEDPPMQEALAVLVAHLREEPLAVLRADAARTPSREDDAIARQLQERAERRARLEEDIRRLRGEQEAALARLGELEEVRRRYRRRRYDARDSVFEGGLDTGDLLDRLARGGIVVGDVLGRMNRHQRFELPGRGRADAGWGVPTRMPTPMPAPRPSRPRSRGGFSTDETF